VAVCREDREDRAVLAAEGDEPREVAPGQVKDVTVDVLVVGSGVAGLSAAVRLAEVGTLRVGVLTKGTLEQSTTRWAQGGVAAVLQGDEDSTDLHLGDTLAVGAGLCDPSAVRLLVDEGPGSVYALVGLGAVFDRNASGSFALAREGGHSMARVVHAGGLATGAEVERALVAALRDSAAVVLEHVFGLDLLVSDGRCRGVVGLTEDGGRCVVRASQVVLATGGAGQLFSVTTNPAEVTGDGIAMAMRAGIPVADLEFVQFHPTALYYPAMPRPLLSEALRGHGALLRDQAGERFVEELASRDVVSRAMARRMAETGAAHLFLDATGLSDFSSRFPTLADALAAVGLNPATEWLPVAPAAHHFSGGVLTDLDGATALPGCWAIGEVACSGVHGANRLASNSLLEGMVFGARAVQAILAGRDGPAPTGALSGLLGPPMAGSLPVRLLGADASLVGAVRASAPGQGRHVAFAGESFAGESVEHGRAVDITKVRAALQASFSEHAGVVRSGLGLQSAGRELLELAETRRGRPPVRSTEEAELDNLMLVGAGLLDMARLRVESRGAHFRSDAPESDPAYLVRLATGER